MDNRNCSFAEFESAQDNALFIALECAMFIFVCSVNLLTIGTVWRTPILKTIPNMYVVSLAVSDLLVGAFGVPVQISFLIPELRHLQGTIKYLCLFGHVLFFESAIASMLNLSLIAVDRAFYIGYPLRYRSEATEERALVIITTTWITSFIISTIPFYYNNWTECTDCNGFNVIPMEYQIYIQLLLFMFLSIVIIISYGYIFKVARNKRKTPSGLESDMKLVKTFMLVFGLFEFCWIPIMTLVIRSQFTKTYPSGWFQIALLLSVLNSGTNFFVYVVRNAEFRKAINKMFCFKSDATFRPTLSQETRF